MGAEPWVWGEIGVVQQAGQSLLVSFIEVRFPQGLHNEGILLFAHELRQRVGQGAPVAILTQRVQQDPSQVLCRHLAERKDQTQAQVGSPLMWPECPLPTSQPNPPAFRSRAPLGGPTTPRPWAPSNTELPVLPVGF